MEPFQYPLGSGAITLTADEALALRTMKDVPQYAILRKVLEGMKVASDFALRDKTATIDAIRVHQGKIEALGDLATIMEEALQQWYEEGQRPKEESKE